MPKGPVVGKDGEGETGVTRARASVEQSGRAKCFILSVGAIGCHGHV